LATVAEHDRSLFHAQCTSALTQHQIDFLLLIPRVWAVGQRLIVLWPPQQLFREGRPVIWPVSFAADKPDRSVVARTTERLGASLASKATTDDNDPVSALTIFRGHAVKLGPPR
jgi:hypothetical protein